MRRRTRLMCHCEEQSDVAISGRHLRLVQAIADRTHLVGGGVLDATPRKVTVFAGTALSSNRVLRDCHGREAPSQ